MAGEYGPISVVPTPGSVNAGGSFLVTVNLAAAPAANETVNIATNNASAFTNLPSSVVVPANQSSVTFNVQTCASASGGASITASAAGSQASCSLSITPSNIGPG